VGADGGAVEEPYRKSSRWTRETWLFYTLAFLGGSSFHILLV
jgi:hypothetical protein